MSLIFRGVFFMLFLMFGLGFHHNFGLHFRHEASELEGTKMIIFYIFLYINLYQ
jgi:hypothetical protein